MKKVILNLLFCIVIKANAQQTASLQIEFLNYFDNEPMVLNTKSYKNALGEQFNISLFQYYISNLRLTRKDGSEYIIPQDESYFLIKQTHPESQTITLNNIPKGTYTGVKFVIGIDSIRSASDIGQRKGCLDVGGDAKDMYWAWNSGYIFVKMEGTSPLLSNKEPFFMYHIGFFGGIGNKVTLNNIKTAEIKFGKSPLKLKSKNTASIMVHTDASKILNGATNISIVNNQAVMGGPLSAKIADNYSGMFTFKGINTESQNKAKSKDGLAINR